MLNSYDAGYERARTGLPANPLLAAWFLRHFCGMSDRATHSSASAKAVRGERSQQKWRKPWKHLHIIHIILSTNSKWNIYYPHNQTTGSRAVVLCLRVKSRILDQTLDEDPNVVSEHRDAALRCTGRQLAEQLPIWILNSNHPEHHWIGICMWVIINHPLNHHR